MRCHPAGSGPRVRSGGVSAPTPAPAWVEGTVAAFRRHGVAQVAYVPDAGHHHLIERCHAEPAISAVPLTTEEEGVALAAGAWLGGQLAAVLMQSSGVGNCVNMFSLLRTCRAPALVVVTMRGDHGEANPWQVPMGQITRDVLRMAGLVTLEAGSPGDVADTVDAAATMAVTGQAAVAVVIGQRVVGAKAFAPAGPTGGAAS